MIERLASKSSRLNGDGQILFEFGLAGEVRQPLGTKADLELPLFISRRCRDDALFTHQRTSSSARRNNGSNVSPAPAAEALRIAVSAAARWQPRFVSAESTSVSISVNRTGFSIATGAPPPRSSSLSFSSRTMRSAVFLPIPGI